MREEPEYETVMRKARRHESRGLVGYRQHQPRKSWKDTYHLMYLTKSGAPYASRARASTTKHGERLRQRRKGRG